MELGSVARLSTLLSGINQPLSDKGSTDGKVTDLKFTSNGDDTTESVAGKLAGESVQLSGMTLTPSGSQDLVTHFKNTAGAVKVDLTVTRLNALAGLTGMTEKGAVDGKSVDLSWSPTTNALTGEVGGQAFNLASPGKGAWEQWQSAGKPSAFGFDQAQTGSLGKAPITLTDHQDWKVEASHFSTPVQQSFAVHGNLAGVAIDEKETPGNVIW